MGRTERDADGTEWYVIEGVFDPYTKSEAMEAKVRIDQLAALRELNAFQYYNIHTASSVLREPAYVLCGSRITARITEGGVPWGFCYVGSPENVRNAAGKGVRRPPDTVFCAYLNPDSTLFEWRLERASGNPPGLPVGYDDQNRFPGGVLWQS